MVNVNSNPDLNFNDSTYVYTIEIILGSISCFSSIFIVSSYIIPDLRKFSFELLCYLSISSFGFTLSFLIYYIPSQYNLIDYLYCNTQAFLMIMFELAQLSASTYISLYTLNELNNYNNNETNSIWKKRIKSYIFIFVLPFLYSLFGLLFDMFGPSGKWCWIEFNNNDSNLFDTYFILFHYFLIWILIIINIIVTLKILYKMNELEKNGNNPKSFGNKMIIYPIISLICWIPATLNRIFMMFLVKIEVLDYSTIFLFHIIGFLYSLITLFNPMFRKSLKSYYRLCCKRNTNNLEFRNLLKSEEL